VLFSGSSPKGKTRSAGAILAGFGLLFVGIDYLQTGMEGVSWNLDAIGGSGFGWQWILAGSGILMSIVMQSSSAAAAATLVALNAGSLTFDQACAMIVGQSVGTAATSAMVAIGAGLAVRRAALAHIVYNVAVGIVGILLLGPLAAAGRWAGARVDDPDGVLALAAFSSIFKLVGILAFYPWLDGFSRFIERISGRGTETAVSRLDPVLAEAGGAGRSRPLGGRSSSLHMVQSMLFAAALPANPSATTRRSRRSDRSSNSWNRCPLRHSI
jgi:phosphate:Na+ symporter